MAEAATAGAAMAGAVTESGFVVAALSSPIVAVAVLGGIIAYEWWKGAKDAEQLQLAAEAAAA
jgi:hypothetical protein